MHAALRAFRRYAQCRVPLRLCMLALLLVIPSGRAAGYQNSSLGAIDGRLADANGKPIPNAAILMSGATSQRATSDAGGAFQFRGVPPGRYLVTATTSDAHHTSEWIDVGPEATARVEMRDRKSTV